MAEPKLTFATRWRYDTKLLMKGTVRVAGFDVEYLDYRGPGGMTGFFREMVTDLPYDIGEQALAHYLIAKDQGKPLTAIAVFPSRFFPHLGVTVATRVGIREPRDLEGKRVAVPDWGFNPGVWMRGILTHQYDVSVERIHWLVNADEPLFRGLAYPRSRRFQINTIEVPDEGDAHGFLRLMEAGEIDGVMLAAGGMPATLTTSKLFADPAREARAFLDQTGVFPINTVITLKETTVETHPALPGRLLAAWREANQRYREEMARGREQDHMGLDVRTLAAWGIFPADYGLAPNRAAIRLMIQYCYEQGLIRNLYEPEDLFTPDGR
jgi:4,5-dihydroxyphthalate decarboxylase